MNGRIPYKPLSMIKAEQLVRKVSIEMKFECGEFRAK